MNKIINIMLVLPFFAFMFGCEEEYQTPSQFSDIEVYVPEWANNTEIGAKLNIDNYFAFADLSVGELSHQWILEEGSGTYFLQENLPSPSSVDNYRDYIDESAGRTSTDARASIVFTKAGTQSVRLYNTFKDSVGFNMIFDINKSVEYDSDLGVWVIDHTFNIEVYDSIVPDYSVLNSKGVEINLVKSDNQADWVTTTVEVGESLTYSDNTVIGRPNKRTWTFGGGEPATSTEMTQSVVYTKVTEGDDFYVTSILSSRIADDLPRASRTSKVPLKIKVIPPSANVEYLGATIDGNGNLVLSLNQGVLLPDNSFITVTNNGVSNPVTSVAFESEDNPSKLVVELTNIPVYGTEVMFSISANTLSSIYETPSAPKKNDDLISETITSLYGVAFEWDFESGSIPAVASGTSPDFGQWAFINSSTLVVDADAFEGAFAGLFKEEPAPNGNYAFTPFFALEQDKEYTIEAYVKAAVPSEVGKIFKFYILYSLFFYKYKKNKFI